MIRAQLHLPETAASAAKEISHRLDKLRLMQPGAWASALVQTVLEDDPVELLRFMPAGKIATALRAGVRAQAARGEKDDRPT